MTVAGYVLLSINQNFFNKSTEFWQQPGEVNSTPNWAGLKKVIWVQNLRSIWKGKKLEEVHSFVENVD